MINFDDVAGESVKEHMQIDLKLLFIYTEY